MLLVGIPSAVTLGLQNPTAPGSASLGGISWTDAAIIAAVVSGVFALVKEGLAFIFRLREEQRQLARLRRSLYGRLLHDYYQMGFGAMKALSLWHELQADSRTRGNPPQVGFLFQHDQALATDVLQLADESLETVTAYLQGVTLRDYAEAKAKAEEPFRGVELFPYPLTRDALYKLLERAASGLDELAPHLPGRSRWSKKLSLREAAENVAFNFHNELQKCPRVSQEDARVANELRPQLGVQMPPSRVT